MSASRSVRSASHGGPRGGVVREVAAVDPVHRREVARVPEEDVHGDDVAVAEPARFELLAESVQRGSGLILDGGERGTAA